MKKAIFLVLALVVLGGIIGCQPGSPGAAAMTPLAGVGIRVEVPELPSFPTGTNTPGPSPTPQNTITPQVKRIDRNLDRDTSGHLYVGSLKYRLPDGKEDIVTSKAGEYVFKKGTKLIEITGSGALLTLVKPDGTDERITTTR